MSRVIVVSNRLPAADQSAAGAPEIPAGGLASAVFAALEGLPDNLWLGWSGQSSRERLERTLRGVRLIGIPLQRSDVELFRPADAIDPEYGRALRRAVAAGVEVLAWTARVERRRLELERPLPIDLERVRAQPVPLATASSPARSARARVASERR